MTDIYNFVKIDKVLNQVSSSTLVEKKLKSNYDRKSIFQDFNLISIDNVRKIPVTSILLKEGHFFQSKPGWLNW